MTSPFFKHATRALTAALLMAGAALGAAQGSRGGAGGMGGRPATVPVALRSPNPQAVAAPGPDSFDVAFHTLRGAFTARFRRPAAPRGADRVWHAVQARYYDGVRFYRVIPGFMAQFGFHGDPAVNRAWEALPIRDDPVTGSNRRGTISFATRGPHTRTTQLFVNLRDNANLDALGFAPVAQVLDGMEVVDSLYSGYGEGAPRGNGPDQDRIAARGNAYLAREFPRLDAIDSARVVRRWP